MNDHILILMHMRYFTILLLFMLALSGLGALYLLLDSRTALTPVGGDVEIFPVTEEWISTTTRPVQGLVVEEESQTQEQQRIRTLDDPAVRVQVYEQLRQKWNPIDFEGRLIGTSSASYDWSMEYQDEFSLLLVTISGYPGFGLQREAEAALLRDLAMSEEEVCGLGVSVTWRNIETDYEFEPRRLTFCE